jgi:PAS domain S-box-containing protein
MRNLGLSAIAPEQEPLGQPALFRQLINSGDVGLVVTSPKKRWLGANNRWSEMIGFSAEELSTTDWAQLTHLDDLAPDVAQFNRLLRGQSEGYVLEKRFIRKNGEVLHAEISVKAFRDGDAGLRFTAAIVDISRWKTAECSLAEMRRRLIEAQEEERARIGRELHDDTCQRLALLAMDIERIAQSPPDISGRLQGLRAQVDEIAEELRVLSHDLNAVNLEYLGVIAGIRSWCTDFGKRHGMLIDFDSDVQTLLPRTLGIALFRVTQESLQNALKHSGEKRVKVSLAECSNEVHLLIHDAGRGFNIGGVIGGLGLISMRERARLIGGSLSIDSKPGHGTSIHVRAPLP